MKKTAKKLISLLLAVTLFFATVGNGWFGLKSQAAESENEFIESGFYTYIVKDGKAEIWSVDTEVSGDITIPATLDGYDVAGINGNAFDECKYITGVIISEGIEYIDRYAFYGCESIENVFIPQSVTQIGSGAFGLCNSLLNITVSPDNPCYTNDEYGVLYNKDKTSLIMYPIASEKSGYTIPSSVVDIWHDAFENSQMYNNQDNWEDGALYIDNHLIKVNDRESVYTVKDGTISIASHAFYNLEKLPKIIIPDSVVNIGSAAFTWSYGVTEIILPSNLKIINDNTFYHCWNLKSLELPETVTVIEDKAFMYCGSLESINIPSGVTYIGEWAFYQCCSLKGKIEIPYGVTEIKDTTFAYCNDLAEVIIPETVTSIGETAFYFCTSLEEIKIPDSVTQIGNYAFYGCEKIKNIIIPDGVISIGSYVVADYSNSDSDRMNLEYVHIPSSATEIGECMLGENNSAYICSDTENCYAKTYAEENGIEFRLCDGHGNTEEDDTSFFDKIFASVTSTFVAIIRWFTDMINSLSVFLEGIEF